MIKKLKSWIEFNFLTWFYRRFGSGLGRPLMITHKWGMGYTFIDRYGYRYQIKETGNYDGSPLEIIKDGTE